MDAAGGCGKTIPPDWSRLTPAIRNAIKTGTVRPESELEEALNANPFSSGWLNSFRKQYRTGTYFNAPRFDRVCVTTLFTFHWDIAIEAIEFAKRIGKEVLIGGILASVMPDKVEAATGIKPHVGSLNIHQLPGDRPLPQSFRKMTIDELPLDYSILHEIDYEYLAGDAYYAYATRGCVNKCPFCAVPKLEPVYKNYIPLQKRLEMTAARFGEQRHLLLLDNNVFASAKFDKIIEEICGSGFSKGATFEPPNQLEIAVRQLREGWNDRAYLRFVVKLLNAFVKKLEGEKYDRAYAMLLNHGLLHDYTATKDSAFTVYDALKDDYEKARSKKQVIRFIDFNQGIDARLATPNKMAKLATVNIRPLRIAFDYWAERHHYVRAVRLAGKERHYATLQLSTLQLHRQTP